MLPLWRRSFSHGYWVGNKRSLLDKSNGPWFIPGAIAFIVLFAGLSAFFFGFLVLFFFHAFIIGLTFVVFWFAFVIFGFFTFFIALVVFPVFTVFFFIAFYII